MDRACGGSEPRRWGGGPGAQERLGDLGRFAASALVDAIESTEAGPRRSFLEACLADALLDVPAGAGVAPTELAALRVWIGQHPRHFAPQGLDAVLGVFSGSQLGRYYADLFTGRLRSLHTGRPVGEALRERFLFTLRLAGCALLVAMLIALPLGTIAAWRQHSVLDNGSMLAALVGISMPNFWLGPLLILIFSVELGWFPVSGADRPGAIVLPAITLGLGLSALLTRMTRSAVLETIREDFVRTARAKGLPEMTVLFRHALRAALIPVVTILGLQFGALLAGSIITEEIFGWPGIGREMVQGIRTRDFPVVQGCVLWVASSYVVVNAVTDVVYTWVNPRVRIDG